jgi:TatD DNase family protein
VSDLILIDSHCHIDFDWYDKDRADVLARAKEAGVCAIVNPAVDLASSAAIGDLAAQEPLIFPTVGIHPNSTRDYVPENIDTLRELAIRNGAVAVGEIGLDYYRDHSTPAQQRVAFVDQLALAVELELPVIIHNRDATADVLAVLADWIGGLAADHPLRARPGVLHSFSASMADMERTIELGFYVGITGPVTFKKAEQLRRNAAAVPPDRLLIETDGPFLTPHPYRGKRNEPAYVQYVADRIAALRLIAPAELALQTTRNAIRLFDLPLDVPES